MDSWSFMVKKSLFSRFTLANLVITVTSGHKLSFHEASDGRWHLLVTETGMTEMSETLNPLMEFSMSSVVTSGWDLPLVRVMITFFLSLGSSLSAFID